ncbi:MAG: hypothetical protein ACTSWM_10835, partial [Alphaproteobacteria bacterium]
VLPTATDINAAIRIIQKAIAEAPEITPDSTPQVGIHEFGYAGIVIGYRLWVPSLNYYPARFAVNGRILKALDTAKIRPISTGSIAFLPEVPTPADHGDLSPEGSL